jgi:hypothetical protein
MVWYDMVWYDMVFFPSFLPSFLASFHTDGLTEKIKTTTTLACGAVAFAVDIVATLAVDC